MYVGIVIRYINKYCTEVQYNTFRAVSAEQDGYTYSDTWTGTIDMFHICHIINHAIDAYSIHW